MNKKGPKLGFIKVLGISIFFVIIFALGLAPMVSTSLGTLDLSVYGYFGSWIVGSLNVWYLGAFALAVLIGLLYGFVKE